VEIIAMPPFIDFFAALCQQVRALPLLRVPRPLSERTDIDKWERWFQAELAQAAASANCLLMSEAYIASNGAPGGQGKENPYCQKVAQAMARQNNSPAVMGKWVDCLIRHDDGSLWIQLKVLWPSFEEDQVKMFLADVNGIRQVNIGVTTNLYNPQLVVAQKAPLRVSHHHGRIWPSMNGVQRGLAVLLFPKWLRAEMESSLNEKVNAIVPAKGETLQMIDAGDWSMVVFAKEY
jgi:hypothetical protein